MTNSPNNVDQNGMRVRRKTIAHVNVQSWWKESTPLVSSWVLENKINLVWHEQQRMAYYTLYLYV